MKWAILLWVSLVSLLAGCARTGTPDIAPTVQAVVAATLTARPAETPTETSAPTSPPTLTPTREPVSAPPSVPISTAEPYTHTLKTYQGQGFSFQYPAGARVKDVSPDKDSWQRVVLATQTLQVIGPPVQVCSSGASVASLEPAYELIIRTYENPERLDAESWARAYLLTSWHEARARKRPWGSLPVSEEGEIIERRVKRTIVAGQPAVLVWFYGFDKMTPAYYLSGDRQIIALSFVFYPVAHQPFVQVQRDVYALILGTLSLE